MKFGVYLINHHSMKTTLLYFFSLILATNSFGQLKISLGGFYSTPLEQFHVDNYSDGGGMDLGFLFNKSIDSTWSMEGGLGFEFGINGMENTELSLGDYELKNKFFNWKLQLNVVKRIKNVSPYLGVHIGIGKYNTSEYILFNDPQEDGSKYYNNEMYQAENLQRGIQLGTYIHVTKNLMLDFGITINRTAEKVKYIDFESFSFDGSEINYNEINSTPFVLLFHGGLAVTFSNLNLGYSNSSVSDRRTSNRRASNRRASNRYCTTTTTTTTTTTNSSSSSSSSKSSSDPHYKNKSKPRLIKNGKTPVGFK